MTDQKSIFFIGGGNMAAAIIGGMNQKEWKITVAEVYEEARKNLQSRFPSIKVVTTPNDPSIQSCRVILFAVKPQSVQSVLESLSSVDLSGKVIASIMAGITIDKLQKGLNGKGMQFIRYMPNTPLLVGKGVTGVFPNNDSGKKISQELLGSASELFYFSTEDSLDKVTALSGSGPAYFYAFIESLRKAGEEMGFPADVSSRMAIGTALGAATLASTSSFDVSELRQQVTSKGGTTAAALDKFKDNELDRVVSESVRAALERAHQLAKL